MPNYIIMWLPLEGRNCLAFFSPLWILDLCIFFYTIVSVSTITSTLKSRLLSKVMMMLETKQRKARESESEIILTMWTRCDYENWCPSKCHSVSTVYLSALWARQCIYNTIHLRVSVCKHRGSGVEGREKTLMEKEMSDCAPVTW